MRFSVFSVADHYRDESRTLREWYAQLLDQILLAEELGFESYFVAEHHFHEYGIVPSPSAVLGAAAARTSRIGLGVAVAQLPFHQPVVAAEEFALLDQLSGGRVRLGVGSGYLKHEFQGFGIGPWEKRFRFDEALEIMLAAWSGERVTYHGLYHHVDHTRIAVTPLQRPHPPFWVAILRPEAAYHVGNAGRNVMLIPYATCADADELEAVIEKHAEGFAESDAEIERDAAVALHAYVGERAETAREEMEEALGRYIGSRLYARPRPFDELDEAGLLLVGDADQVSERVAELQRRGTTQLMILPDFGALPAERVRGSMERFAREVMPNFAGAPVSARASKG